MTERITTRKRSFSDLKYSAKKNVTWRDRLLGEINGVTLLFVLMAAVELLCTKDDGHGEPPIRVELTLRMYIAQ